MKNAMTSPQAPTPNHLGFPGRASIAADRGGGKAEMGHHVMVEGVDGRWGNCVVRSKMSLLGGVPRVSSIQLVRGMLRSIQINLSICQFKKWNGPI